MAKHLYLLVFFDDTVESPMDTMGDYLESLPPEHTGQNYGIDHMVMSEVPLTAQDAENFTVEDDAVEVLIDSQQNGYEQ